jgi:hypothetical protein
VGACGWGGGGVVLRCSGVNDKNACLCSGQGDACGGPTSGMDCDLHYWVVSRSLLLRHTGTHGAKGVPAAEAAAGCSRRAGAGRQASRVDA